MYDFQSSSSDREFILPISSEIENELPKLHNLSPTYSLQPLQEPRILFIVGDPTSPHSVMDQPFISYMESLNFSVLLHDDNNSFIYDDFDTIVISQTIAEEGAVNALYNASIPILTMESGTWNEFQLGPGQGPSPYIQAEMNIINNSHYITNGLNLGNYPIYNTSGEVNYFPNYNTIPVDAEIIDLTRPNQQNPSKNHRSLVVLEKGKKDWNLTIAPERRAFWGPTQGLDFNQTGWYLWEKTLKWLLYDDTTGKANIQVTAVDADNRKITDAIVTLTNSTHSLSQNTSSTGQTSFTNIDFGQYNISVNYRNKNKTLVSQYIVANRTFQHFADFEYTVQLLDIYIDTTPPIISNVGFIASNLTFFAEVIDDGALDRVNLSFTVKNNTDSSILRDKSYFMVSSSGSTYYNDTALLNLDPTGLDVSYNITAFDVAGNNQTSENYYFLLGDVVEPIINEYNVTDHGNGLVTFYALVTDEHSLVDEVILSINDSLKNMYQNSSGYWIYQESVYYDQLLNYSIFSAKDSVGNINNTPIPEYGFITPTDTQNPHIWGRTDTFESHLDGFVEFSAYIDDWNEYQSRVNSSTVKIHISIKIDNDDWSNITENMLKIGDISYYYENEFGHNDTVFYRIVSHDLAGNVNQGIEWGPFIVNDTSSPIVTYRATEWGNSTVDFHAEVKDWPDNNTIAFLLYTQDWFGSWSNVSMIKVTETNFTLRVTNNEFQLQNIWYYVSATDSSDNSFEPTLDQAFNVTVTDKVSPTVFTSIENSTENDGEITVIAYAIDQFGDTNFVNNTFYINITQQTSYFFAEMEYDAFFRYKTTQSFPDGEDIIINIWVADNAGNLGNISKSILVKDYAPPNIKNYGSIVHQNGTVIIWAEIVEGEDGSGLTGGESSIAIEYVYISTKTENMSLNGSENYYSYSISGFFPDRTLVYRVIATDKNGNLRMINWEAVRILDLTPPVFNTYNSSEKLINHTTSEISFWAEVEDPFGEIKGVNISIGYLDDSQWITRTYSMNSLDNSYFNYNFRMICEQSYNYSMSVYDEFANTNNTPIIYQMTLDFRPATALHHGIEFKGENLKPGEVIFWIKINDAFNNNSATISVNDESTGTDLITDISMNSNGTHYLYLLEIPYMHNFTYFIEVSDPGVFAGYYESIIYQKTQQFQDHWPPTIHDTGIERISNSDVIIWANISDWGSGISDVVLKYEFNPIGRNGGTGSDINAVPMTFNDSLYTIELSFSESGSIDWFIEAYDSVLSSKSSVSNTPIVLQSPPARLDYLQIILMMTGPVTLVIVIILSIVSYQRFKYRREQKRESIDEKLSFITNIFTILVATEVGVPIYNVSNVLYQQDASFTDVISGISVSIDSFLDSFQTDFMQQIHRHNLEQASETEAIEDIRYSQIEQNKVHILIVASETFRIFVFLREKPPSFVKDVFCNIISKIEKDIFIQHLGVIDEVLLSPKIEQIIRKFLPIPLLSPFSIDILRLKKFNDDLKTEIPTPISRAGINALKRLIVSKTNPEVITKDPRSEIKFFNEIMEKGVIKNPGELLFKDAREIMKKLLNLSPEHIFQALWVGSSPEVGLIIAKRD
jgi:hypothetical protein